ncbi:MAG: imidazole glycerol phosphate synthase subunit HisH [Gemmatimonadaceae bacterium]|nr:imidazole glycerol phosphate synthase subunit HisH [Gemmatimonadaceae bacterium]
MFDYGAGNLHSLIKTLETASTIVRVETDPARAVQHTDALVLPGVGAFAPAAERLASGRDAMREALLGGLPCLGICLGMQLLFDSSEEGPGAGLSIFAGHVTRLHAHRVPQIGWNQLEDVHDPLAARAELGVAYFANSFVCRPTGASLTQVVSWSTHERDRYPSVVRRGAVVGTQFHPEKSSAPGVRFVHAFLDAAAHADFRNRATGEQP